jgi:hypothetical protein
MWLASLILEEHVSIVILDKERDGDNSLFPFIALNIKIKNCKHTI